MPRVHELITELAIFEKEPNAVKITAEDLKLFGFGTNPKFHCFVAEIDDKIEGIALVYPRFSTWNGLDCKPEQKRTWFGNNAFR